MGFGCYYITHPENRGFPTTGSILYGYITRNPLFRIPNKVRLKPGGSATETSWNLENLDADHINQTSR